MKIIQSEAMSSLFCFQDLFRSIFGRRDYRFYDELSRLIEADYNGGSVEHSYAYDVAGNMVNYDGVSRTYNAVNQMTNDGTNTLTYDNNGNLKNDGTNAYTWDRANRLSSVGNHSYKYDGLSNRVQQTVNTVVTDYLNDVQPGLTKLLKQDDGTNVERFVHAPRGIHAVDDGTDWNFYAQDGLGSVRAIVDDAGLVQSSMSYDPYGQPNGSYGEGFGFTGEQTDANGSVFLRARYYEPEKGSFIKRDPAETANRYQYVRGNPVNRVDPTGLFDWSTRTVEEGDRLWCIAREGTVGWIGNQAPEETAVHNTVNRILSENPRISNSDHIEPTWVLNIPDDIAQVGLQNADKSCNPKRRALGLMSGRDLGVKLDCPPASLDVMGRQGNIDRGVSESRGCCGPDVTEWFKRELGIHALYAYSSGEISATRNMENLDRLAVYGLAVDYGFVPYRNLALQSAQNEGGAYLPTEDSYMSGCGSAGETPIVTICGRCQNATDLGNFIFGFSTRLAGWSEYVITGATSFNFAGGIDQSIIADTQGLLAGYNFIYAGALNDDTFCSNLESIGTIWLDSIPSQCSRPCSSQNLNCAQNSTAGWNTFVSNSVGGSGGYGTPLEQLRTLPGGNLITVD